MGLAGRAWRTRRSGGVLRPEVEWEVIDVPGVGRQVLRRVPSVELILAAEGPAQGGGAGAVLVIETHDLGRAAELAWRVWALRCPGLRLSQPLPGWWRPLPGDEALAAAGTRCLWWPARPGGPGSVPGVEFAMPVGPATYDDVSGPSRMPGEPGAGGER